MENLLTVQENFSDTVSRYVSRELGKGKDLRKTMERLMGYWVLNALKNTAKAKREEIIAYYMQSARGRLPKTRKGRSKAAHEMSETLAIVIIRHINYEGARFMSFEDTRKKARVWIGRRAFAAGVHRAGFLPALRVLRKSAGERLPRFRHESGTPPEWTETPDQVALAVTNFTKVIGEIAPLAFESGGMELQGFLGAYLSADLIKEMNNAGLNAK